MLKSKADLKFGPSSNMVAIALLLALNGVDSGINDGPRSLLRTPRWVCAFARPFGQDMVLLRGGACELPFAWTESYLAAKWGDREGSATRRTLDTCLEEPLLTQQSHGDAWSE